MEQMFNRLGRQVVRFRWPILLLWLGLLVLGGSSARHLPDVLKGGGFGVPSSESARVSELLKSEFPGQPAHTLLLVFRGEGLDVDDARYRRSIETLAGDLEGQTGISRVLTAYNTGDRRFVSDDGKVTFALLALKTSDPDEARDLVLPVRKTVKAAGLPEGLTAQVTGEPAIGYDTSQAAAQDLPRAERVGLPITLLTLLVVFGALVAAALPLLIGVGAIAVTMGIVYFLSPYLEFSSFIQNVVPMLGLGVGIDYCLLMVSRFREELAAGLSKQEAVVRSVTTAGRAIAFSGGTVAVGLAALLVPNIMILRSLGLGGILVVAVAVLAALTLLPAVLVLLGDRVNAPRFLSRQLRRSLGAGFWHRWALRVMKRPVVFLTLAIVTLGLLAYPALRLETLGVGPTLLPEGIESRAAFETLADAFGPGELGPINIVVDTQKARGIWKREVISDLYSFTRELEDDPRVANVNSLVSFNPEARLDDYLKLYADGSAASRAPQAAAVVAPLISEGSRATLVQVVPSADPSSMEARELVETIRGEMIHAVEWPAGTRLLVGGSTASSYGMEDELYGSFPLIIGLVLGITFLMLLVLLGSVVLPVKAILANALSVLASYGLLVLVFQDGWGADLLGFTPPGAISSLTPVFLFCILFGLSMDYEIFLLSRMREAYNETRDNEMGIALGLERTGGIITSAALIMITVFLSFALTGFVMLKEFGLGMSAAVFLDAALVRVLLVPAVMRLLGRWNWWAPSFLRAKTAED